MQALGQTAEWFRRALAVEPVRGNLRLSGYSACGQDGGVQLPREYVEGISIAEDIHMKLPCFYYLSRSFLVIILMSCLQINLNVF